ncbi:MFS general substrate transporter [Rhizodiscina lignyota]|uniref:MFS general substrate transporter n=1 Tax=Rhizodiscina lignyota TaxID=1504668 RepID=A0A9P4IT43_9PEZI|nr:MFS general substrate transporter [Rhizodiscina lignyota]
MEKNIESGVAHDETVAKEEHEIAPSPVSSELDYEYLTDKTLNKSIVKKIDLRVLPLCCWIYLLNYLDRGNVGNAKVLNQETGDDLLQQTHMSATGYAVAVSLFSVAYTIFEVPSNMVMKRWVRPSLWLGFLLFGWGVLTMGFAGVHNYATVVVLRFLIGAFEAGFFPGIVYFITMWYRVQERSLRIAFVVAHANLAGAFGGAIAYGFGEINGSNGLQGFRWLFIVEGLITALCCLLVILFLPDYPSRARWLTEDDKKYAEDRLKIHGGGYTKTHATWKEIRETCFSPRMLLHYLIYILDCVPLGSFTFFTPTLVTGLGYKSLEAQLLTIPPWVCGYTMALVLSFSADHFNARGWHVAIGSVLGGAGWLTAAALPHDMYTARYGALVLAACGAFPVSAPLSAWVTCNVPSLTTMFIATALNNSCAGVSQVIAQWIWKPDEAAIGYPTGNYMCAGCSFAVAILSVVLRLWYGRMNKHGVPDASGNKREWLL